MPSPSLRPAWNLHRILPLNIFCGKFTLKIHVRNSDMNNMKCISLFCNAKKKGAESIQLDTGYLLSKIFILLSKDTFEFKDISLYLFNFKNKCFLSIIRERMRLNGMKGKCNISYLAPRTVMAINLLKHRAYEALVKLEKTYFVFQKWIKIFRQSCIYKERVSPGLQQV